MYSISGLDQLSILKVTSQIQPKHTSSKWIFNKSNKPFNFFLFNLFRSELWSKVIEENPYVLMLDVQELQAGHCFISPWVILFP